VKYVYVVTRIMKSVKPGIIEIPNLGVHTSYEKAETHFKSVVDDRYGTGEALPHLKYGRQWAPTVRPSLRERFLVINSVNIKDEEIRLEKWLVQV